MQYGPFSRHYHILGSIEALNMGFRGGGRRGVPSGISHSARVPPPKFQPAMIWDLAKVSDSMAKYI